MLRGVGVVLILTWIAAFGAAAQTAKPETRVALVIGNSTYEHAGKLPTPPKDAADMVVALEAAGFKVIPAIDVPKRQFDKVLRGFVEAIEKADVALLFYAGHGIQIGDKGFLVPIDASLKNERDAPYEAVALDFVLREMTANRGDRTSIVLLDACRDNPLSRTMASASGATRSLAGGGLPDPGKGLGTGLFVAFATEPGKVALDQEQGAQNSPFTRALLAEMLVRGRSISDTMIAVRNSVSRATNGAQVPWDQSSLTKPFTFLVQSGAAQAAAPPASSKDAQEVAILQQRLADLEAEQKRWAAEREKEQHSKAAAVPSAGAADMRLIETRLRVRALDETVKDLQRRVLETRTREGRATDPAERQRIASEAMAIQLDMSRKGVELKRLREELVLLEAPTPPVAPGASAGRAQFNVRLGMRTVGELMTASPSTANCESRCQAEPRCMAWNLSRGGECELLSGVTQRVSAGEWRTGVRLDVEAALKGPAVVAPNAPPIAPKPGPPPKISPNFEERENVGLMGVEIGQPFRAPSPIACRQACEANAECVGYQHGRRAPMAGMCELFSRLDARREDATWRSGVRVEAAR
ncbi:MAG: caspase family protein [Hyphomicrobiaceae bacterium]